MKVWLIVLAVFLMKLPLFGQDILKIESFKSQVLKNHPIAKSAGARILQADAKVLLAKSAFDPSFIVDNSQKTLNDKNYFNYTLSELVYQSPYAVKLKAGFESTYGGFLNPTDTKGTLGFLGLELPVLRGLLTDYKRTELRKSQNNRLQNDDDRSIVLNDLLLESLTAYWEWTSNYRILNIVKQYQSNALKRLELVKVGFRNGDRAMVDTIEASTQYQKIKLLGYKTELDYTVSKLRLAQFIWDDNGSPYFIANEVLPDTLAFAVLSPKDESEGILKTFDSRHPELNIYRLKLQNLDLSSKLYRQNFLPELNLKANILSQRNLTPDIIFAQPANENYKFGFTVQLPLAMMESRGNYRLNKYKIVETKLGFGQKAWEIENKIRVYGSEVENLAKQVLLLEQMNTNFSILLKNEDLKLTQGESNLFLINSRENTLLDNLQLSNVTKQKLIVKNLFQYWAAALLID